jgi:hypothetical protein
MRRKKVIAWQWVLLAFAILLTLIVLPTLTIEDIPTTYVLLSLLGTAGYAFLCGIVLVFLIGVVFLVDPSARGRVAKVFGPVAYRMGFVGAFVLTALAVLWLISKYWIPFPELTFYVFAMFFFVVAVAFVIAWSLFGHKLTRGGRT